MKNFVKVFSVVLSLVMIIAMVPCGAFAATVNNDVVLAGDLASATDDTATQDQSTPDVSTPDVSTPDVSTPDVSTPDVSTPDSKILGDVDSDGDLNIKDATLIQLHIAKLDTDIPLDLSVADYNKDGSINILDVTYIQFKLANLTVVLK